MNKTILIVDDSTYKVSRIVKELNSELDNPNIIECFSRNEGINAIKNNKDIDLIILDWNFPIRNGEFPEPNMGLEFLDILQRFNINIDVIICTSEISELINESLSYYPNVIGVIQYDLSIKLSFKEIIGRSR